MAALLVVMGHIRALFFLDYPDVSKNWWVSIFYLLTGLGHQAVMVFFVLSGYWVGGTVWDRARSGSFSWSSYAIQRLSRLWVVLIPGLAVTAACALITLYFARHSDITQGAAAYHGVAPTELAERSSLLTALGNVFFLQEILVPAYSSNGALWSLAYEFWFYAMFPLLILAIFARSSWLRALYGILLIACGAIVGPVILSYFLIWLMGAGVAGLRPLFEGWIEERRRLLVLLAQGFGCGALLVVMAGASVGAFGSLGDLAVATAATVVVTLLSRDMQPRGIPGRILRPISAYAEASFSLYVVHLPLVALAAAVLLPKASERFSLSATSALIYATVLTVLLVSGWLFASVTEFHTTKIRRRVARLLLRDTARV